MTDLSVYPTLSLGERCLVFDSEIQIPTFTDFDLASFFPLHGKDLSPTRNHAINEVIYFLNQINFLNTEKAFSVKKLSIDKRFDQLTNSVVGWGYGQKEETLNSSQFLATAISVIEELRKGEKTHITHNGVTNHIFCVDFSDICTIPFKPSKSCRLLVILEFDQTSHDFFIHAVGIECVHAHVIMKNDKGAFFYSL
ncbi:MAG: hypothetical protein WC011_02130 [Candidatus Paceibacterota bacterium]